MKKKIICFFIIVLMFFIINVKNVYGTDVVQIDNVVLGENMKLEEIKTKIKNAATSYYPGKTEESAVATMQVTKNTDENGKTTYKIGKNKDFDWSGTENQLSDENNNEDTWQVLFDIQYEKVSEDNYCAKVKQSSLIENMLSEDEEINLNNEANTVGVSWEDVKNATIGAWNFTHFGWIKMGAEAIKGLYDAGKGAVDIAGNFSKNFWGTLITMALDTLVRPIGDIAQSIANLIQTATCQDPDDKHLLYTREELDQNENVNKYTNVKDYKKDDGKSWQKIINIPINPNEDSEFDDTTSIPVLQGDIYNIAIGHVDFLDVNFLTGNMDKEENNSRLDKFWLMLRNFAVLLMRIAIYIACAIILITLFTFAIRIAIHSIDSPEEEAECKEGLMKLAKSIIMLIGTIVIMGLCIFGSRSVFQSAEQRDSYELPIRVNVENAGYSFSTTVSGYLRYVSNISDVDRYAEKTLYVFSYIAFAAINCVVVVFMLVRMFALWFLSILGPIISAFTVFDIELPISYGSWVSAYVWLSMIQVVLAVGYMILLNCIIK